MVLPATPLSEWNEADLQRLVDIGAQESDTLDFKRDMYGAGDEDRREMLRDISSMANHRGGHIIIGIEEDEDGIAKRLPGVDKDNHVQRIMSSCLANIERHLNGLGVEDVPLSDDRVAVVIRVPQSFNSPHMVTFKGLNQFWTRHGRQKAPMTVDELNEAFDRATQGVTVVERFIAARKGRLKGVVGSKTWVLLTATPLLIRHEIVDTTDASVRAILEGRVSRPRLFLSRSVFPSLDGLRAQGKEGEEVVDYIELHRNGHLEFATVSPWLFVDKDSIPSEFVLQHLERFLEITAALWQQLGLVVPLAFTLTVFNARGLWFALPRNTAMAYHLKKKPFADDQDLGLPILYVEEVVREHRKLLKTAGDRLWNAFGLEQCTLLNDEGEWA